MSVQANVVVQVISSFRAVADSHCGQNAVENLKKDFGIVGYHGHGSITIRALFYNEDGTVQGTPVLVASESWADLMPHVHKIFIRTS
jgi:hypothetical protein